MTNNRTELALKACEGLSDAELAERGEAGFKKMIERKRAYAGKFRGLAQMVATKVAPEIQAKDKRIAELEAQLADVTAKYDELLAASVEGKLDDTTEALGMLDAIKKKKD
jgi:hypothetical protein